MLRYVPRASGTMWLLLGRTQRIEMSCSTGLPLAFLHKLFFAAPARVLPFLSIALLSHVSRGLRDRTAHAEGDSSGSDDETLRGFPSLCHPRPALDSERTSKYVSP
jgi:hypothetical protein